MVLSCFLMACVAFTVLIWRREAHGSRWDLAFRPRPAEKELVAPWWWAQVYAWSLIAGILSILALTVLA